MSPEFWLEQKLCGEVKREGDVEQAVSRVCTRRQAHDGGSALSHVGYVTTDKSFMLSMEILIPLLAHSWGYWEHQMK